MENGAGVLRPHRADTALGRQNILSPEPPNAQETMLMALRSLNIVWETILMALKSRNISWETIIMALKSQYSLERLNVPSLRADIVKESRYFFL